MHETKHSPVSPGPERVWALAVMARVAINTGTVDELEAALRSLNRFPTAAIAAIVRLRPFRDFEDLRTRVNAEAEYLNQRINSRWAEHLSVDGGGCRVRDAEYAAELLGLRLDVPWSIWDGYEAGGREPGILWRYAAAERTFTVRFENELELDDLDDVSWEEVLDEAPMAKSAGELATLHRLDELPLVRPPRGAQPSDGVWRMRGGLWMNRHGMALYEDDTGASDSADDDESHDEEDDMLGSARPARARNAYRPLRNHLFCVRRRLQRLRSHAFGPRPSPRLPRAPAPASLLAL